jgi:hypothetical protein
LIDANASWGSIRDARSWTNEKGLRGQALITLKTGFSQLSASADTRILYVPQRQWLQPLQNFPCPEGLLITRTK